MYSADEHPPPQVPATERWVPLLLRVVRLLRVRGVPAAARARRRAGGAAGGRTPRRALRPRHHDARNRLESSLQRGFVTVLLLRCVVVIARVGVTENRAPFSTSVRVNASSDRVRAGGVGDETCARYKRR